MLIPTHRTQVLAVMPPLPPPAGLGQVPSVLGGLSLQTAALGALAAYVIYRFVFSSPARARRAELRQARQHYAEEVARIKAKYR